MCTAHSDHHNRTEQKMKRTFFQGGVHIQIINSSNSCIVATTEDKIEERDSDAAGKEIRQKDKQERGRDGATNGRRGLKKAMSGFYF